MRQYSHFEVPAFPSLALLLLASLPPLACAADSPSPCRVKGDCYNTHESQELGRCAPREVACIRNACRVACPQPCEVLDPQVNPCRDTRLVCSQSKSGDNSFPYCASGALSCTTADECPIALAQADGGNGAWACVGGVCQFPGYRFVWQ